MSNNPFASDMNGEYVHRRDPPPPPPPAQMQRQRVPREKKAPAPPPPSYEEAAGSDAATREYPKEKPSSSSTQRSSSSRPHRSHSDSARHRSHGERRHHKSRTKSPSKKKVEPHKSKNLDTIDKLDVSAFFGGRFHHDGPFDACTPHRNKNEKNAPVAAFPADGPNTLMKAFGPGINNNDRMNLAFGNYSDEQNDITSTVGTKANGVPVIKTNRTSNDPQATYTPRLNPSVVAFDVNQKAAPIHGLTTAGLGLSTFLDGAPAPRNDEYLNPNTLSGLGRKKSLVQRLRKNSLSEAPLRLSGDNSGEYTRTPLDEDTGGLSLLRRVKSLKVGRK